MRLWRDWGDRDQQGVDSVRLGDRQRAMSEPPTGRAETDVTENNAELVVMARVPEWHRAIRAGSPGARETEGRGQAVTSARP